jgi:predicted outer membrane repeat protein
MSRYIGLLAAMLWLHALNAPAQIMFHQEIFVGGGAGCDFSGIQAALDAANAGDYVYVTPSNYTGHLHISKALNLAGTDTCGNNHPPPMSQPFATIDGSGGANAPVLDISGSGDFYISGLEFTGGHANSTGGGVNFHTSGGSLHLSNVAFIRNSSLDGGGLAIAPVGSTVPDVYLGEDVQMLLNSAGDAGGGMYVGGSSQVYVTGKGDFFALNSATHRGGGIFVQGPAQLTLASPGLNGALVIENTAERGGGIAADVGDQDGVDVEQIVSLYTTDPFFPGAISSNQASIAGGGVYLKSQTDTFTSAEFCAMDFRINQNSAPQGAALFSEGTNTNQNGTTAGRAYLNTAQCRSVATFNPVHCAPITPCNEISGNTAEDASFHPTDGAIVELAGGRDALLYATHLNMRGNSGGYLFLTDTNGADLQFSEFLTGGNTLAHEMIRLRSESDTLALVQSTLAPDIINSTQVIAFDSVDSDFSEVTMRNLLIDEPGTLTLKYPGDLSANNPHVDIAWLLSNDISALPSGVNIVQGTPLFVDAGNADPNKRDYHLRAYVQNGHVTASPGIDFSPAPATSGGDLDGKPFGQDVALVPDFGGTSDLGAYEAQPIPDRIFADAFDDPTSLVY